MIDLATLRRLSRVVPDNWESLALSVRGRLELIYPGDDLSIRVLPQELQAPYIQLMLYENTLLGTAYTNSESIAGVGSISKEELDINTGYPKSLVTPFLRWRGIYGNKFPAASTTTPAVIINPPDHHPTTESFYGMYYSASESGLPVPNFSRRQITGTYVIPSTSIPEPYVIFYGSTTPTHIQYDTFNYTFADNFTLVDNEEGNALPSRWRFNSQLVDGRARTFTI